MNRYSTPRLARPTGPLTLLALLAGACSGGQSYDDGSDALGAKTHEEPEADDEASTKDAQRDSSQSAESSDATSWRASELCDDDCYVVNSALTGNSEGEVFVASYFGISDSADHVLRRYSQGKWMELARWEDPARIVRQLWATPTVVYAATEDGLWRYDLKTDEREELQFEAVSVWGFSEDSVFALTDDSLAQWDGEQWSTNPSPLEGQMPLGIVGDDLDGQRGPEPVFIMSAVGAISHFGGDEWEPLTVPLGTKLNDFAVDGDTLYAIGGDDPLNEASPGGLIARFTDTQWSVLQEAPDDALLAVAVADTETVYAVGATRASSGSARAVVWKLDDDEGERLELDLDAFLWDVWCDASATCYAAGTDNVFLRVDTLDWSASTRP